MHRQDRYQYIAQHESPSATWGLLDGSPQLPQQHRSRVSDAPGVPRRNLFAPNMGNAISPAGIELSPVPGGDLTRHEMVRYETDFRGSPAPNPQQQVVYQNVASNPFHASPAPHPHQQMMYQPVASNPFHVQEISSKVIEHPGTAEMDHGASHLPVISIENKDDASMVLSHQVRICRIQKMAQDTGMDLFLIWLSHLLLCASLFFLLSATDANGVSMDLENNHFGGGQPQVLSGPFFYTFLPVALLVVLCLVETMAFFKFSLDHGVLVASYVYSNRSGLFCVAISGNFFVALSLILLYFYLSRFPCCDFLAPAHLGVFYVMLPVTVGIVLFVCWCAVWLMRDAKETVEQSLRADLFPTPGRVRLLIPCLFLITTEVLILLKAEGWVDILWIFITTPLLAVFAFWVGDGMMTAYRYDSKAPRSLLSHRNLSLVEVLDGACMIAVVATAASAIDRPSWNEWRQGLAIPLIVLVVAYSLWMLAELYLRYYGRGPEDKRSGCPDWLDPRIETVVQPEPGTSSCSTCGSVALTYAARVVWACPDPADDSPPFAHFVLQLARLPQNTTQKDDGKLGKTESVKVEGSELDWAQVYAGSQASITLRQLQAGCSYAVRVRGERSDRSAPNAVATGALGTVHPPASHAALHVHAPRAKDASPAMNQKLMPVEPTVALAPAVLEDTQNSARVSALEDVVWELRKHNHVLGSELADMRRFMESNNLPQSQTHKYWEQVYNQREASFRGQRSEHAGGVGLAGNSAQQPALKREPLVRWARLVDLLTIAELKKECRLRVAENVGLHMCLRSAEQWGLQQSRELEDGGARQPKDASATVEAEEAAGPRLGESLLNLDAGEDDEALVSKHRVLSLAKQGQAAMASAPLVMRPEPGAREQVGVLSLRAKAPLLPSSKGLAPRDKAPLLPFSQGLESSIAALDEAQAHLEQMQEMVPAMQPDDTPALYKGAANPPRAVSPSERSLARSASPPSNLKVPIHPNFAALPPQAGQTPPPLPLPVTRPDVSQPREPNGILSPRDKAPLLPFSQGLESSVAAVDETLLQLDQTQEAGGLAASVFDVRQPDPTPPMSAASPHLQASPSASLPVQDPSPPAAARPQESSSGSPPPKPPLHPNFLPVASPAQRERERTGILSPGDKAPLRPFSQGLENSVSAINDSVAAISEPHVLFDHRASTPPSAPASARSLARSASPPPTTAERNAGRWERLVDRLEIAELRKLNRDRQAQIVGLHLCLKSAELYERQSRSREASPEKERPASTPSPPPPPPPPPPPVASGAVAPGPASARHIKRPVDTHVLMPRSKAPLPGQISQTHGPNSAPSRPVRSAQTEDSIVVETTPQPQVFVPGHPSPLPASAARGGSDAAFSELRAAVAAILDELVGSVVDRAPAAKPDEHTTHSAAAAAAAAAAEPPDAATEPAASNGEDGGEEEEPSIEGPFLAQDHDSPPEPIRLAQRFDGANPHVAVQTVSTDDGYLWDVAMGSSAAEPAYHEPYHEPFHERFHEPVRSAVSQSEGGLPGMFRSLGRNARPQTGDGEPRAVWTLRNQSEEGGIGLLLEELGGRVTVKRLVEGGSAERDGRLRVGDEVVLVDGRAVEGLNLKAIFDMIKGQPGTQVTVTVRRQHAQRVSAGTPFLPGMGLYVPPFGDMPRSPATFSAHIVTIDRQPMVRAHT